MSVATLARPEHEDDVTAQSRPAGTWATLVRGWQQLPELRRGVPITLVLAAVFTAGRIVVPLAVQRTIDRGLASGEPETATVRTVVLGAAVLLVLTGLAGAAMNVRLYRTTESALSSLRVRAFRHVHDLSVLHQAAERRGSLVARVTTDVDTMSMFMQWGGVLLVISSLQVLLATVLMLLFSWQLTLVVYLSFVPYVLGVRAGQRRLAAAYAIVRERVGDMLGAVGESVVGAQVIRAYGVEGRTAERIDGAIDRHRRAATKAQGWAALMSSSGELAASAATAFVVVAGVLLGVDGQLTAGELVGFLFLVTLFVQPVQIATEVLNEAQTALAGFRRVLGVLDAPTDVADPGPAGTALPPGPVGVRFDHVSFAYPGGPTVLDDVDLEIAPRTRVAVVGETGSGKTTFAKLLTRLMDPADGRVLLSGVGLADVPFTSLRARVVMVPQDGFLFDASVLDNTRYGRPTATDAEVTAAYAALGLDDWLATLPDGVATVVGERGESLSVGERQLVAVARAYLADPDLLVLDEATSAVDPATEVRLNRALDNLTRGRTTVAIAHRLSTAEAADEVVVVDRGRVVQRGPHRELVAVDGVYARLHESWVSQAGQPRATDG